MMVSKTNHLFQGLLFRFHVKFQGCTYIDWDAPPSRLSMILETPQAARTSYQELCAANETADLQARKKMVRHVFFSIGCGMQHA